MREEFNHNQRPRPPCHYGCGRKAKSRDHRVPQARGGGGGHNIVPACPRCNHAKGDRAAWDFEWEAESTEELFARLAPFRTPYTGEWFNSATIMEKRLARFRNRREFRVA